MNRVWATHSADNEEVKIRPLRHDHGDVGDDFLCILRLGEIQNNGLPMEGLCARIYVLAQTPHPVYFSSRITRWCPVNLTEIHCEGWRLLHRFLQDPAESMNRWKSEMNQHIRICQIRRHSLIKVIFICSRYSLWCRGNDSLQYYQYLVHLYYDK